ALGRPLPASGVPAESTDNRFHCRVLLATGAPRLPARRLLLKPPRFETTGPPGPEPANNQSEDIMNGKELEEYRQLLLDLNRRLGVNSTGIAEEALRGVGGGASGSLSNTPLHLADL